MSSYLVSARKLSDFMDLMILDEIFTSLKRSLVS